MQHSDSYHMILHWKEFPGTCGNCQWIWIWNQVDYCWDCSTWPSHFHWMVALACSLVQSSFHSCFETICLEYIPIALIQQSQISLLQDCKASMTNTSWNNHFPLKINLSPMKHGHGTNTDTPTSLIIWENYII